jgi:DNA primase
MEYQLLLTGLESVLGKGHKTSKDNYSFHCPFCNHSKRKLEIDLHTNEKGENRFACWVCGTRGKSIHSLLKQIKVPVDQAAPILKLVPRGQTYEYKTEVKVELPKEFKPLYEASTESIIANKIKKYLYKRGLTDLDFLRYNIGYCLKGEYEGRVIIPSYDSNGHLNFFTSRTFEDSYFKYKNPSISRDIIFFENLINWDLPLTLVEGPFDALAVRRNVIPILGKTLSKALMKRIVENRVKEVYVMLDQDANKEAIRICELLLSLGKTTYLVDLKDKDPSEIGFYRSLELINNTLPLTESDIIKLKINN